MRDRMLGRSASEDNHQMSLSAETRREHAFALLNSLYVKLGDFPIDCTAFDSAGRGLCSNSKYFVGRTGFRGHTSRNAGNPLYFFTAKGWSEALFLYGNPREPSFQQRLGKLSKVLKNRVKGRVDSVLVSFDEVTSDSGLPPGWGF